MIVLERLTAPTDEARALIDELDADLRGPYDPDQHHGFSIDRVFATGLLFFLAKLDGQAVGCGGIAFDDGYAELKRMYVRPTARGRGVAQAVLERLEAEAKAKGYKRLTLETGDVQHAAIKVYERAGFAVCAPFGEYLALPPHTIERSIFMAKAI
ncbi:MAG: GNAT family N-acetyltransferase [Alphaproteobacteria bacterium]|nr:GNAT family N-acetyltransferase [Alphaproteobacteria bacterium]